MVAFEKEGPNVTPGLQRRLTEALKRNAALVTEGEAERDVYATPEGANSGLYWS